MLAGFRLAKQTAVQTAVRLITTGSLRISEEALDKLRARAADEFDLLPDGSAIAEMLADYSVMPDQARACR